MPTIYPTSNGGDFGYRENSAAGDWPAPLAVDRSEVPADLYSPLGDRRLFRRSNQTYRRVAAVSGFGLVNIWLVYHLAAIVLAPWVVPPSSRLVQNAWRGVGRYDQVLFLNHGYHYFAPEPGNSTLLGYTLEMPDGHVETGRIPNREIRPRLFYHRHFMLTEALGSSDALLDPDAKKELIHAMARELCTLHGARRVTLSRFTHRLPSMEWVRAGGSLDDPSSYIEEPLGTFSCDEL
jgi:hypothetical protein